MSDDVEKYSRDDPRVFEVRAGPYRGQLVRTRSLVGVASGPTGFHVWVDTESGYGFRVPAGHIPADQREAALAATPHAFAGRVFQGPWPGSVPAGAPASAAAPFDPFAPGSIAPVPEDGDGGFDPFAQ